MKTDDPSVSHENPSGEHGTALARLVAECLERRGDGEVDLPYQEICRDHPELLEEVRTSVEFAGALPKLQAVGSTGDPLIRSMLAGRYRIDSRLGSGAMGVVYAGTDLDLGRRIAVKIVHTRFLDASQAMARFDREAAALAAISHDSVVTIYDRGITEQGAPFLVMELIDGIPCSEVLHLAQRHKAADSTEWLTEECGIEEVREASLVRQMVRWIASLANGLEAAHAAGVYHRDVKPSNIMIRRDGRAVLLDFGIATMEDDETLTRPESAVGTPAYMAPESLLGGKNRARPSQDVYGLAATLYHLLTLEAPYRGTPTEILAALATREPMPAVKVRPGLPRDAQAILDHGLARAPGQRYATPGAMEKDLRALLAFQPVSVNPTTGMTRAFRRLRRSKMMVGALLATVLMGGALGAREMTANLEGKRKVAFYEAYDHVPANLGIVMPANRAIADEGLRQGVAKDLDTLVNAGHGKVTARTLRASFRLDHGDVAGAKEDMRAAAATLGTGYARELAKRYEALPAESHSALDLDLEDLPDLDEPLDFYLAGYHALRTNRHGEAVDWLLHPDLAGHRHSRELSALLTTVSFGPLVSAGNLDQLAHEAAQLMERVREIESQFGSNSAMSNHLAGIAMRYQFRYADCVQRCSQCYELAPASLVALINGADAARLFGEFDVARSYIARARLVVPVYLKLDKIASEIELEAGDHGRSHEILSAAPFPEPREQQVSYLYLLAKTELGAALDLYSSNPAESKKAAQRARVALEAIPAGPGSRDEFLRYAKALESSSRDAVFLGLVQSLQEEPFSRSRLALAIEFWPSNSTEPALAPLAAWCRSLLLELDRQSANLKLTLSGYNEK